MIARDSISARLIASASAADGDVAAAQKNASLAASLRPDFLHPAPRPGGVTARGSSGGGAAQRPLAPETAPDFPRPPLRTRLSSQGWGWNWGWQGTTAAPAPRRAALDNHAPIGVPALAAVPAAPPLGQGAGADADLPRHRALAAAALGILLGLAILAACAGLGLWLAAAVFHSGVLA